MITLVQILLIDAHKVDPQIRVPRCRRSGPKIVEHVEQVLGDVQNCAIDKDTLRFVGRTPYVGQCFVLWELAMFEAVVVDRAFDWPFGCVVNAQESEGWSRRIERLVLE